MATLSLHGQGSPFPAVASALSAHVSANKALPQSLDLSKNQEVGIDGTIQLANDWLAEDAAKDSEGIIKTLNLSSCSIGREVNPETGAYIFAARGVEALGAHAHRILSLDLAWNDLNADAIEALVKGLVGVKTPEFEAESYDPATLLPTRTCALESLNLKGNQIGDDGVEWLAYMLRKSPTQSPSAPNLRALGLCQSAVEARGAGYLQAQVSNGQLTSLNLNDNDVAAGTHTLALAAAAARLPDFGGLNLAQVAASLETARATVAAADASTMKSATPVTLKAGKDSMAHGALALLEVLRMFTPQVKTPDSTTAAIDKESASNTPQPNPLVTEGSTSSATSTAAAAGAVVPVVLDLRGSRMCGFYAEHTWAVDALVAILEAQQAALASTAGDAAATKENVAPLAKEAQVVKGQTPASAATPYAEAGMEVTVTGQGGSGAQNFPGVRVVVQTIELDEGCGLVPNQLQVVFDACDKTTLNVGGKPYEPPRGLCSIQ